MTERLSNARSILQWWNEQENHNRGSARKDESHQAFSAFVSYRDMGPGRSIRAVGRQCSKSASLLARWSSKNAWASRVAAWDAEEDRRKREAHLDEVAQMSRRHAEVVQQQLRVLCEPAAELARRLEGAPQFLKDLETKSLLELVQRGARPIAALMEAEREVRGDRFTCEVCREREAERRDAEQMSRAELEAYLTGVEMVNGRDRAH